MTCYGSNRLIPAAIGAALSAGGMVMAGGKIIDAASSGGVMCSVAAESAVAAVGGSMAGAARKLIEQNSVFRSGAFVIGMLMVAAGLGLIATGAMMNGAQTPKQNVSTVLSVLLLLLVTMYNFAFLSEDAALPDLCLTRSMAKHAVAVVLYLLAWLWVSYSIGMNSSGSVDYGKVHTAMFGGVLNAVGMMLFVNGKGAESGIAFGVGFLVVALSAAMIPASAQCASTSLVQRWQKVLLGR